MQEINVYYKPELNRFSDLYYGTYKIAENFVVFNIVEGSENVQIVVPLENIFKIVAVTKEGKR